MKFLAIILSVYFLGLNFTPCDDAVTYDSEAEVSVVLDADQDHQESGGPDDCTPFCLCHCCHVHVTHFNGTSYEGFESTVSTLIIQKGERLGQEIPHTHFQPPRV